MWGYFYRLYNKALNRLYNKCWGKKNRAYEKNIKKVEHKFEKSVKMELIKKQELRSNNNRHIFTE